MRVKISYTIPVEESLDKSEQFLDDCLEQLVDISESLKQVKNEKLINSQPFRTYERMDDLRRKLFEVDANIDNAMSLIKAHLQFVTTKDQAPQVNPEELDLSQLEQINTAVNDLNNNVEKQTNDG